MTQTSLLRFGYKFFKNSLCFVATLLHPEVSREIISFKWKNSTSRVQRYHTSICGPRNSPIRYQTCFCWCSSLEGLDCIAGTWRIYIYKYMYLLLYIYIWVCPNMLPLSSIGTLNNCVKIIIIIIIIPGYTTFFSDKPIYIYIYIHIYINLYIYIIIYMGVFLKVKRNKGTPPKHPSHWTRFPKMGVPLNHPFSIGIYHQNKPSSYDPPWLWKPRNSWKNMVLDYPLHRSHQGPTCPWL